MRIDTLNLIVPQIELLKTREILAEITIELRDAIVLKVKHQQLLE